MRRTHPTNMFVCECITQSLFRLMKRKPYNKITVTDLVQEAGVSRNSFYRNYQSTEEIIRQFLEEGTSKWWSEFIAYPDRYPHVIAEMFRHFLDMREEIDLLYPCRTFSSAHGAYCSMRQAKFDGRIEEHISNGLYVRRTLRLGKTNGYCGGMEESPEEMEQMFSNHEI